MAEQLLDLRGLICADRAERIRAALDAPGLDTLRVVVDDDAKADHARDTAGRLGWAAVIEHPGAAVHVLLRRSESGVPEAASAPAARPAGESLRVVVYVSSSLMGVGDEQLGRILMRAFIKTLKELDPLPEKVLFVNSGVRLTTEGSELIADLRDLEGRGVRILSCGTCLDYYHLNESLQVGTATNIFEITTSLVAADRVLKP